MPTFVTTVKFTQQGMKDIQATCKRADAFTVIAGKMGVEVRDIYWTMGPQDGLIVFDAPDDAATALMLHLGSFGNVQTQTSRAYRAVDMAEVLGKLSG